MEIAILNQRGHLIQHITGAVCVSPNRLTRWPAGLDIRPGRYVPIAKDNVMVLYPVGTDACFVERTLRELVTEMAPGGNSH